MSAAGVLDRIERLSRTELTAKALREASLEVLRRAIPFDAHVWLLTDPVTTVGTSPLADVPMMPWPQLPQLGRSRYLTTVNRWPELRRAEVPAASLVAATGGDPSASALWRDALHGLGVTDVASVVFADRFGCWGWLDLWRCGGTFSADEVALLGRLSPSLTEGLRAAQSRTFVEDAERLELSGPAVVLLGPGLDVVSLTTTASLALRELNPPEEVVADPIPAAAMNVGAALLAAEAGVPVGPPWSRVHLGGGCWVTLRAERLTDGGIAVTIETSTPAERREVFALAHGLSPREREVLAHLATGADSRSVARALALSEHTVNDHVRAVLAKTGSATRQVLLSRIAGS